MEAVPPAPSRASTPASPAAASDRAANAPRRSPRARIVWAVLGLVGLALLLYLRGLGSFGLVGPDEPRYAAIAAGMAARRDYVLPQLLGRAWLEKPPLYYWLAAGAMSLGGPAAGTARLPDALLGLLLALGLGLFLARVRRSRAGLLAAMLVLTAAFPLSFARAATTDMGLAAMLTAALVCLWVWFESLSTSEVQARQIPSGEPAGIAPEPSASAASGGGPTVAASRPRRTPLFAAAAALALATLAKGPVAVVLAALIVLIYLWRLRRWRWLRATLSPAALAIFFVVAAPWYVLVSLRDPAFPRLFFWGQNVERFATNRFAHPQPVWFFLPVLFLAVFPWSGWIFPLLAKPLRAFSPAARRSEMAGAEDRSRRLSLFLWLWVLVPLIFFSVSRSKLPSYVFPAVPPLLLLMAMRVDDAWDRLERWPALINAALTGLIPAALLLFPWLFTPRPWRPPATFFLRQPWVWFAGLGTIALLSLLILGRRWVAYCAATCAYVALAVWALTGPLASRANVIASSQPLASAVMNVCGPPARLPLPLPSAAAASAPFAAGPCAGGRLFAWKLNRQMAYGLEFYLHRRAAALPATRQWPSIGLVATDRRSVPALVDAARARGLDPRAAVEPPLGANWYLVRLFPAPTGEPEPISRPFAPTLPAAPTAQPRRDASRPRGPAAAN